MSEPLRCVHHLGRAWRSDGGVVAMVLDLVAALAEAGAQVTLLTGDARDVPASWRGGGANVPEVVEHADLGGAKKLSEAAQRVVEPVLREAEVLHLHTPWEPLNPDLAASAQRVGRPYVVTIHGMLDDWSMTNGGRLKALKKRAYLKLRGNTLMRRAASVQCTAEAEREQATRWVSGMTTAVIPCLVDARAMLELERPAPGANSANDMADESNAGRVLFLSRMHPKKRPDLVLEAAAELPTVNVVMAGPADDAYGKGLLGRAEELSVSSRVDWLGMVVDEEKRRAFAEADVFVLPTSQENFGIVLIEAMAAGLPLVTTRGADLWRELEAAGATIVEAEASAIAGAIRAVLDHPAEAAARGQRGRAWVEKELSPSTVLGRYLNWYRQVVSSASGG
ncbi:MAG: glycosyltransferase [Planctomycetota bacterium]